MSQLQKQAKQNTGEAQAVLEAARGLRELLYRLFSSVAQGPEPDRADTETFLARYAEAISHGRLVKTGDHFVTVWKLEEVLEAVLWPIVHSAGALLFSEELTQVKECPGCGWLFLDMSKNQTRRWCSMDTCGARDKMRRYLKRKQGKKKTLR
jgi:predicted RNA-binding Zn ribbon-like protein